MLFATSLSTQLAITGIIMGHSSLFSGIFLLNNRKIPNVTVPEDKPLYNFGISAGKNRLQTIQISSDNA